MTGFGVTHRSGLSVGIDPARGDLTPDARGSGAVLSVGTIGSGIKYIINSVVSVDAGGVTASRVTFVPLTVANVQVNDYVSAAPTSLWSGAVVGALGIQSYTSTGAGVVMVALSNNSGNNITVPTVNWRVVAIGS
jgi:hypothetical protein